MQFHLLSFEGPDPYAYVGGLATRVDGLTHALAHEGYETHLWFVGDADLPGEEQQDNLTLHRWCQWISRHHRRDVYDGENEKVVDYARSLPPFLLQNVLIPYLTSGRRAVILAEEWQTVDAVLHLDGLLREAGIRNQVSIFWNANNIFGFERIDFKLLEKAACITTVSRYMKHRMQSLGVDSVVIPNGLAPDAYIPAERSAVNWFRRNLRKRTIITKMARWDPGKGWLASVRLIRELKRRGWRPLWIARGGTETHGEEVMRAAFEAGLRTVQRDNTPRGIGGLFKALEDINSEVDVVSLQSHVDPESRRVLFRASDAVLANSNHEPFGLVGLETMAVGGIACTGCSGEDYAVPGRNALVLQTEDPREFVSLYRLLREKPGEIAAMRQAGRSTARDYSWPKVIHRNILPRLEVVSQPARVCSAERGTEQRSVRRIEADADRSSSPLRN